MHLPPLTAAIYDATTSQSLSEYSTQWTEHPRLSTTYTPVVPRQRFFIRISAASAPPLPPGQPAPTIQAPYYFLYSISIPKMPGAPERWFTLAHTHSRFPTGCKHTGVSAKNEGGVDVRQQFIFAGTGGMGQGEEGQGGEIVVRVIRARPSVLRTIEAPAKLSATWSPRTALVPANQKKAEKAVAKLEAGEGQATAAVVVGYAEPEVKPKHAASHHKSARQWTYIDTADTPFATFRFLYRDKLALQVAGLMPYEDEYIESRGRLTSRRPVSAMSLVESSGSKAGWTVNNSGSRASRTTVESSGSRASRTMKRIGGEIWRSSTGSSK